MKNYILLLLVVLSASLNAQVHIIPAPSSITQGKGFFKLSAKTVILISDDAQKPAADFLSSYIKKYYAISLKQVKKATGNYIKLNTLKFIKAPVNDEHYTFTASINKIEINGDSYRATFWGVQSLIQLLPVSFFKINIGAGLPSSDFKIDIPVVTINDTPRFSYRGMHLDVSRHFFPASYIKKYIDLLALHKINTFHWHLTDDQGWRIEIKKYPRLTSVGGYRNGTIVGRYPGKSNTGKRYGGYYTQNEIKDIIAYAAKRYINIIPEIEMPGHASAAIAAYPYLSCFPNKNTERPFMTHWNGDTTGKQVQQTWGIFNDVFCAGKDSTFIFIQNVLDEVAALFPSTYIHIGGDECPKAYWKQCPDCQQRIVQNNLKDEHGLQSYFIQRIEKHLNKKNKKIIGWNEILEGGLAPNATVMSWQGEKGGIEAAKQSHDVIMTPASHLYFDYAQSKNEDSITIGNYVPIEKVYSYNPIPASLTAGEAKYIKGAQANIWTEYVTNTSKLEYMVLPRMAALSEVLWSETANKNWNAFFGNLKEQYGRYDLWKVNYKKIFYLIEDSISAAPNNDGVLWSLYNYNKDISQITVQYSDSIHLIDTVEFVDPLTGETFKEHKNYKTLSKDYYKPILILESGKYIAEQKIIEGASRNLYYEIIRTFNINKATGKKITLSQNPSTAYPGNGGAFGLVNGLITNKGSDGSEWLGWKKEVEIIIDLNKIDSIETIKLHYLSQMPSGIYAPKNITAYLSNDGIEYTEVKNPAIPTQQDDSYYNIIVSSNKNKMPAKFIKLIVQPVKDKWVLIDEVEVY